jgi:Ca2+-binding EF-hand superfamily protein
MRTQLSPVAILTALASLSLAGGCRSDDAGGSKAPQEPAATAAAPAPAPAPTPAAPPAPWEDGTQPAAPAQAGGAGPADTAGDPLAARRMQRREEMKRKYDANGDGRLSKEERATMRRELIDRRMSRMDRDGDGKISRDEAGRVPMARRLLADFNAADSNHDSFISRDELEAAVKQLQQQRREARLRGETAEGQAPPAAGQDQPAPANR